MRKLLLNLFLSTVGLLFAGQASAQEEIAPGIIKLQAGEIDTFTPYSLFGGKPAVEAMKQLPAAKPPFSPDEVQIKITDRGCLIEVPLEDNEQIYGFGLQFETFGQRGLRKRPIVNDNPLNGLGYTHAPQTFYVSTKGYGILVNTARYTTFLCGSNQKTEHSRQLKENTLLPPQKTCIRTEATEIKSISTYPAPKALRYLSSPDRKCWM
jgi:alpha-D-xyloside xylohydrolase